MHNIFGHASIDFMDSETKTYEVAYLLKDSSEEEIESSAQKLREIIENAEGLIVHESRPQKQILSYPIGQNTTANFGSFGFILTAEKIPALEKSFRQIDLLRFLLFRIKTGKKSAKRTIKIKPSRPVSAKEFSTATAPREEIETIKEGVQRTSEESKEEAPGKELVSTQRSEPLQVEEIDKKLEEILGE